MLLCATKKYSGYDISNVIILQNAQAQLSYQLQAAKEKQKIRKEEIEIDVVQRRKQIDVEAKEIERKDRELEATVRKPTEAEAYKVKTLAEGKRYCTFDTD